MSTEKTQETEASDISKEELKMLAEKLFDNELDRERINERKIRTQLTEQLLNTYKTVRDGLFDRAERVLDYLGIKDIIVQDVNVEPDYVYISFEDIASSINDNITITTEVFNFDDYIDEFAKSDEFNRFIDNHNKKIGVYKKQIRSISEQTSPMDLQILKLEQQLFLMLQKKYASSNGIIDPTQMGDFILKDSETMIKSK